jgi:hypothetical protein
MTNSSGKIVVEVVNTKTFQGDKNTVTYIGRPTILGNPFAMSTESERTSVCDAYESYFRERVEHDEEFRDCLDELAQQAIRNGYVRLGCFCKPKRCHGDTVASYLNQRIPQLTA